MADEKTCVFWDVVGYPVPGDCDPCLMKDKIKSVLVNMGYGVDVSIQAYGNKNTFLDQELLSKFSSAGIEIDLLPDGDKYAGIYSMLVETSIWVLNNPPPSNLIVLSKNTDHVDVIGHFGSAYIRRYGVVLSDVEEGDLRNNDTAAALLLTSLFDRGNPNKRKADTPADSEDKSYVV